MADNTKWITIHPNNAEPGKGKHILVDTSTGEPVGGNKHLVDALKNKGQHEEAFLGDNELGDLLSEGAFLGDDELKGLFSDEQAEEDPKSPKEKFDFVKATSAMNIENAVSELKSVMPHVCKTSTKLAMAIEAETGKHSLAMKVMMTFGYSSEKAANQNAIHFATTVSHLKTIMKPGALDLSKTAFSAAWRKGMKPNAFYAYTPGNPFGWISMKPMSKKNLEYLDKARKLFAEGKISIVGNVDSRYPKGCEPFITSAHEIAHALYRTKKLKYEWDDVVQSVIKNGFDFKKGVSSYAWCKLKGKFTHFDRINEAHSECFAMIAHPDYKPGTLPKDIEDYFRKNFFNEEKLPS